MYGAETSSLSSTIAKCWDAWVGSLPGSALSWPRWAISRVIRWNASRPVSVKSNWTIGSLPPCWLKVCSGLRMSVPESAGLSSTIQKRSGSGESASGFWSRTTRIPSGTRSTSAFARSWSLRSSSAAARVSDGWPLFSGCLLVLLNA
jgi:hypothetical protein